MLKKAIRYLSNPGKYLHIINRRIITHVVYKRSLKSMGERTVIGKPLLMTPKCVSIGNNVLIWPNCRIEGITRYNDIDYTPEIFLDDFCSIQQNLHLTCANKIYIGKHTAIAANVTITDIHHQYENINKPIEEQDILVKQVHISDDCKIYNNAVILPGTHIGKHCTVGANSVVSGEFPDFSVIAGSPAKIVKRYNFDSLAWEKTNAKGEFLRIKE